MKKSGILIFSVIACLSLCLCFLSSPYELNYKHIAINTPIEYTADLENTDYPSGEKYLAHDLAMAFNDLGYQAKAYALEDGYSNRNFNEGFEIYMRTFPEMDFDSYHAHIDEDRISVIFETLNYTAKQLKNADIVFTGSKKKNDEYKKIGINSFYVPQFTRLDKFYYSPKDELKTKVLFVGNQWNKGLGLRKSIQYALNSGIELDVYGSGWHELLDNNENIKIRGEQISGDELKHYYSSAEIVLNDTHQFMIDNGFISNRVFDVTASQGFLISDYNPAIAEIYGDAIPMYKNEQEFRELIEYYLAHPEERKEKTMRAYEITKNNFSAQKVVSRMIKIMKEYYALHIRNKTFQRRLAYLKQKITKWGKKKAAIRINLSRKLADYNMYAAIEYFKDKLYKKGYETDILFGGELYNFVADDADINVFIRGSGPFLDARMNNKAKNLYFALKSDHVFPEEFNNYDGYLVNSQEFLEGLKAIKNNSAKLVFGSAMHEELTTFDEYDILFISDTDKIDASNYINNNYSFKAYTGMEFVALNRQERENLLAQARLVVYMPNPYTFNNNIPYAVLDIVSYGRPVLTAYTKILYNTFGNSIEMYNTVNEMKTKTAELLSQNALTLKDKAKRARKILIEITEHNDIF